VLKKGTMDVIVNDQDELTMRILQGDIDVIVNDQDELTMRVLQGDIVCNDLEVIDACRGTGIGSMYNKIYQPYDGECRQNRGSFVDGMPIYRSGDVFMYAIGVYADDWSKEELRGLHRWRIASFQSFSDSTSCRIEEANVNQIDFAALGQPYNFFPTIACFDRNGDSNAGFKSSTINLRCNDFNVIGGGNNIPTDNPGEDSPSDDGRSGGAKFGIALGVLLLLGGLAALAYYGFVYYKKQKKGMDYSSRSTESSEDLESGNTPSKDKNKPPIDSFVLEKETKQKESKEQAKPKETKPEPPAVLEKDTKQDEKSQLPPAFQFLARPWENKSKETKPEPAAAILEKDAKEGKQDDDNKSKLPPAFQFLSRPKTTNNESHVPKKIVPPQKIIVKEDKKAEEPQLPPAFQFMSRPKNTKPVPAPVPVAPTTKAPRRQSVDPPAVDMSNREEEEEDDDDDAIPASIRNMVSELDSFFDDDEADKPPDSNKRWTKPTPRQRSLSPSPASKYSKAAPLNKRQGIDPSEHNMLKNRPGMGSRNRSFTPSNANKFDKKQANPQSRRPRSLSPSPASKFGKKSATPDPKVQSPSKQPTTRSRSLEPSNAGKYGKPKPRPRSIERTPDPKKLSKPRDRSLERPTPDSRKFPQAQTRSRSLEPSNAGKYGKPRPRSMERTPDPKKLSKPPVSRASFGQPTPEPKKLPTASASGPITGKGSRFDASKLNSDITVNADGSVSVTERKTREDGAIVRSKTTYSDKKTAAQYGFHV
jgi:hypothetical protein